MEDRMMGIRPTSIDKETMACLAIATLQRPTEIEVAGVKFHFNIEKDDLGNFHVSTGKANVTDEEIFIHVLVLSTFMDACDAVIQTIKGALPTQHVNAVLDAIYVSGLMDQETEETRDADAVAGVDIGAALVGFTSNLAGILGEIKGLRKELRERHKAKK